jgi:hypothetical protein
MQDCKISHILVLQNHSVNVWVFLPLKKQRLKLSHNPSNTKFTSLPNNQFVFLLAYLKANHISSLLFKSNSFFSQPFPPPTFDKNLKPISVQAFPI